MRPIGLLSLDDENDKLQNGSLSANQQGRAKVHHDAIEFPDATCVLLTSLVAGQKATVLQLPAQPKTPAEEAAQKRFAYVG